jgi:o-succinylbenzoate synthase
MKIRHITFTPYELPFKTPLITSRGVTTRRKGFLVKLQSNRDTIGMGEVAPLAEYGTESIDEAAHELERLTAMTSFPSWPDSLESLNAWSEKVKLQAERTPAVRFGIESALLAGICQDQELRLEEFLCEDRVEKVHVNALLSGKNEEEIIASAKEACANGFRTLKVKIGIKSVTADVNLLKDLRALCSEQKLRVDVNGAWSLEQALQFAEQALPYKLEYIEDPLAKERLADLKTLHRQSKIPIAVDEGARSATEVKQLINGDMCDIIVLKPTAIGSYAELEDIFFCKGSEGIVVSSLMESSVGLSYLTACAAAFGSMQAAHGLSTALYLSRDTLKQPLIPERGRLSVPDVREIPSLRK